MDTLRYAVVRLHERYCRQIYIPWLWAAILLLGFAQVALVYLATP